ncbi:hypothetical protein CLOHIR_01701 [Peptacetobacter hiranonis DSM 13275]|uniref:Uncharacterized protein n=1 Tax=Peptacetobacter hiranonis (strain DSM 13275 / JCM 10541 / KCTC 15199 / TO-931) TaxID=500633 RepID=B6G0P5_PEPHT|nr:hypothetical protein CLOHIR_01701 [Peptacetobacter hiranonis DSM 13275]
MNFCLLFFTSIAILLPLFLVNIPSLLILCSVIALYFLLSKTYPSFVFV